MWVPAGREGFFPLLALESGDDTVLVSFVDVVLVRWDGDVVCGCDS
jgi:hypothetical protein